MYGHNGVSPARPCCSRSPIPTRKHTVRRWKTILRQARWELKFEASCLAAPDSLTRARGETRWFTAGNGSSLARRTRAPKGRSNPRKRSRGQRTGQKRPYPRPSQEKASGGCQDHGAQGHEEQDEPYAAPRACPAFRRIWNRLWRDIHVARAK